MIGVDIIGQIRRVYFEQQRSIREIVRTLRVSRATVRKVIRSQATEFKYERGVQPAPKLGQWVAVLVALLEKEAQLPRRERRSTQRLFEELRGRGYDGAHDSVHRFVKAWRDERAHVPAQAFVPMSFAPGEAYQFDWSHETITLQGLPLTIKAAHMKLSHSRMPFVRTYHRETQELVLDAHDKAFLFYGGACRRGIYDNMKTAVEAIFVGKARQYNRRFLQMAELELIDREQRTIERRIKAARFPAVKSLDSFDFLALPSLNKAVVLELARSEYIARRENVIAVGNSGTGKTHIALGLGLAACQKGLSVGFTTAAALVHELIEARDEKRLLRLQRQLAGYKLLIIDELGYVPLSQTGAELLFEVFSQRYERGSTIVTSNLPFDEWTGVFASERLTGALLDRLTSTIGLP